MKIRILLLAVLSVAGFAFSQTITPESRASAERLLQVLKMGENFDNTMKQAVNMQLAGTFDRMDISEEKKAELRESMNTLTQTLLEKFSFQSMKGMFIDVYAEVFTKEELDGVIAFYESPAGQKFVVKQPELTRIMIQKIQTLMAEIQPELRKEAELLKKQMKAEDTSASAPAAGK